MSLKMLANSYVCTNHFLKDSFTNFRLYNSNSEIGSNAILLIISNDVKEGDLSNSNRVISNGV